MSLTLRAPLCKANNSALVVVAPVSLHCLDMSQWVATPLVRSAMDVVDILSLSSLAKSISLSFPTNGGAVKSSNSKVFFGGLDFVDK
eukprot:3202736-Ditylum_brightwellii.AAC.1